MLPQTPFTGKALAAIVEWACMRSPVLINRHGGVCLGAKAPRPLGQGAVKSDHMFVRNFSIDDVDCFLLVIHHLERRQSRSFDPLGISVSLFRFLSLAYGVYLRYFILIKQPYRIASVPSTTVIVTEPVRPAHHFLYTRINTDAIWRCLQ